MSKINKVIGYICLLGGAALFLFWRDLGATIFLIGAVNFALYKKGLDGAVI